MEKGKTIGMIIADKRDYKNGYKKHYVAYRYLKKNNDTVISRCLLLVYTAECGLKCLLLSKWRESSPRKILDNNLDERSKILKTHNIQKMLMELGQSGYRFPQIVTQHGDYVSSDTYHQLCRYGIDLRDNDKVKAKIYEEELLKVVNWIEREI